MGAQHDDTTATSRLRLLYENYLEHPRTAPDGPRPRAVTAGTPLNLATLDHIAASVDEVTQYTREVAPDAAPRPEQDYDVYRWCVENTAHAPEDVQQRRDVILYRQRLEHAIAMGEAAVIRPHRCPACNTFSLMWRPERRRALCTNGRCRGRDGMSRTWTLARIAYEHVAVEKTSRECAT